MSRIDAARLAAYDVLVAVREDDAYANLVLPALLRERGSRAATPPSPPSWSAGRCAASGRTTPSSTTSPVAPPDPAVRDALRLGAHQVLAMRVPDHAAVASTVELVRERVGHKPAGFTNALMRRIAARDLDGVDGRPRRLAVGAHLAPGVGRRGARPRARPARASSRRCSPPTTSGRG